MIYPWCAQTADLPCAREAGKPPSKPATSRVALRRHMRGADTSTCFGLGGHAAGQASREGTITSTIEKRTPKLQHFNTPTLHYSITPLLHYSITPLLHYSITPLLRPAPTSLQAKVRQAGMIQWARERSVPMKFAFGFFNRQIVNGGVPMMH